MIEVAVVLSGVVRHWPDFFIILVLLFANAIIGFWEERQAGDAIEALKARLAIKARVKRDGKWITPPAKDLVPGDVVRLRLGDIVPADARLLAGDEISVDQSALTGESLPATRKSGDATSRAHREEDTERLGVTAGAALGHLDLALRLIRRASPELPGLVPAGRPTLLTGALYHSQPASNTHSRCFTEATWR
jgi:magnesium-transporting ATPase (P-type)